VQLTGGRTFVVADIPGIIEGAHAGKGLGHKFLRHVERTRVLAFLVPLDSPDVQATYAQLREEIRQYSADLAKTPHVVLLSKRDLLPEEEALPELDAPEAVGILAISSAAGTGLDELKEYLWKFVAELKADGRTDALSDDDEEDEFHIDGYDTDDPTHDARSTTDDDLDDDGDQ